MMLSILLFNPRIEMFLIIHLLLLLPSRDGLCAELEMITECIGN